MFSFKLFGGASIEGADGPLTGRVAQRRRLGLLALLATSPETGVSRDKLRTSSPTISISAAAIIGTAERKRICCNPRGSSSAPSSATRLRARGPASPTPTPCSHSMITYRPRRRIQTRSTPRTARSPSILRSPRRTPRSGTSHSTTTGVVRHTRRWGAQRTPSRLAPRDRVVPWQRNQRCCAGARLQRDRQSQ